MILQQCGRCAAYVIANDEIPGAGECHLKPINLNGKVAWLEVNEMTIGCFEFEPASEMSMELTVAGTQLVDAAIHGSGLSKECKICHGNLSDAGEGHEEGCALIAFIAALTEDIGSEA